MKKHASETALLPDLAFVTYFECFLAKSFESEHEIEKKIHYPSLLKKLLSMSFKKTLYQTLGHLL